MIARFESQKSQNPFWLQIQNSRKTVPPDHKPLNLSVRWLLGSITAVFILWLIFHRLLQPAWFSQMPEAFRELLWLSEAAGALTLILIWLLLWWRHKVETAVTLSQLVIPNLSVRELYDLSPREFEEFVAKLFRKKGYRVRVRGRSGDKGVDLELIGQYGKRAIVQCKRYRSTIGPEIIRELYGTLMHERVAHAFLVTSADISGSARQWAQGKPITLIDGQTLVQIASVLSGKK